MALRGGSDGVAEKPAEAIARVMQAALADAQLKRRRGDAAETDPLPELKRLRATMARRLVLAQRQRDQVEHFLKLRATTDASPAESISLEGDRACVICLEEMTRQLKALPCGHVYHEDCIARWANYNRRCPIDRRRFE